MYNAFKDGGNPSPPPPPRYADFPFLSVVLRAEIGTVGYFLFCVCGGTRLLVKQSATDGACVGEREREREAAASHVRLVLDNSFSVGAADLVCFGGQ